MFKLIDVGEKKLECLIAGSGKRNVVIMPGMGGSIYHWLSIIEEISQHAKIIAIHRSGVGNSQIGDEGSSTLIASKDLYNLLLTHGIKEKVILVGHSYGGLCVQHFARLYPDYVESILLVESASMNRGNQFDELDTPISNETTSDEVYIDLWKKYSKYTREQLMKEIKPELSSSQLSLPIEIQKEILEFYVRPEIYEAQLSEILDLKYNVANIKMAGAFPKCPLIVLVEDPQYSVSEMVAEGIPKVEAVKIERLSQNLSHGLRELSDKCDFRIVKDSNHCINETRPDEVIKAIKELVYM
ncbi:alpha/beta fold hydrolase [Clostridium sp. UBA4548]|uniref:alpha/beta fold hydrolase n=1 Tax=Clostridium sp. UBA4548 TaxID=1946361 RepID=UPI0025B7CE47|nr:alpha/beta hydrolase [Clostridium sp. UBA4548]